MKAIEEQFTLQGNQAKLYDANIKVALARVGILEKENIGTKRYQSYPVSEHVTESKSIALGTALPRRPTKRGRD